MKGVSVASVSDDACAVCSREGIRLSDFLTLRSAGSLQECSSARHEFGLWTLPLTK